MRGVDAVMRHLLGPEQYVTACYARLNRRTKTLTVVSAGHPPLILVRHTGLVQIVEMDGGPLGIFSSLVLQRKDLTVGAGDRFYLYSDGMIESSPGGGRRAGMDLLARTCAAALGRELAESVRNIAAAVRPGNGSATDDLLLLGSEVSR